MVFVHGGVFAHILKNHFFLFKFYNGNSPCNFFIWVDEAGKFGLLNGEVDQDVLKVGLLRKKDKYDE